MAAAEEQRAADVGAGGTNSGIDHASGRFRSSLNHCIVRIPDITMEKHMLIIGGGMAGLAAGCYARMNGFKATVVELLFGCLMEILLFNTRSIEICSLCIAKI